MDTSFKLCSGRFRQLFSVCWCYSGHCNQVITSNVTFIHLSFESPCFVCVYTSFTVVFYQFYSVVLGSSIVSKEPHWVVFVAVTFALLGFLWYIGFYVFYILTLLSAFMFVFCSTSEHFCCSVLWEAADWSHTS